MPLYCEPSHPLELAGCTVPIPVVAALLLAETSTAITSKIWMQLIILKIDYIFLSSKTKKGQHKAGKEHKKSLSRHAACGDAVAASDVQG